MVSQTPPMCLFAHLFHFLLLVNQLNVFGEGYKAFKGVKYITSGCNLEVRTWPAWPPLPVHPSSHMLFILFNVSSCAIFVCFSMSVPKYCAQHPPTHFYKNMDGILHSVFPGRRIVSHETVQELWRGYGSIVRLRLDKEPKPVILKFINAESN